MEKSKEFNVIDRRGKNESGPVVEEVRSIQRRMNGPGGSVMRVAFQVGEKWPIHEFGVAINHHHQAVGLVSMNSSVPSIVSGPFNLVVVSQLALNRMIMEETNRQRELDRSQSNNAQKRRNNTEENSEKEKDTNE